MPRTAQPTDFVVSVENVGQFTFGKRTMRDEIAVQREYARILDGVEPTNWLNAMAGWLSALKVLTVRAPDGWDIDEMDPLDTETYAKLNAVHAALVDKERSFRPGTKPAGEASGAGQV